MDRSYSNRPSQRQRGKIHLQLCRDRNGKIDAASNSLDVTNGVDGRVLVSRDVTTMPEHFAGFVAQHESPGMLLIPSRRSIGTVIEGVLMVWLTWTPEDLRNQARWIP